MQRRLAALLGRLYRDEDDRNGGGDGAGTGGDGGASGGDPGARSGANGADAGGDGSAGKPAAGSGGKAGSAAQGGTGGEGDAAGGAKGKDGAAGAAPSGKAGDPDGGTWGADWRAKLAGQDEAKLKRAGRYADPAAIFDSLIQLQDKIARGELRSVLPKDATPAQVEAWRKEQGIPEAPEKYDLGEVKVPDEDKPTIDSFLKAAHAANMPTATARATVDWYYKEVERQTELRAEADKKAAREAEEILREDWGNTNFRANLNHAHSLIDTAPEAVREDIRRARLANGTPLLADPAATKWLLGLALEINPVTALDLPSGGNVASAIDDEIKGINDIMRKDRARYNNDPKMQARLRDLLAAREKAQSKR